MGALNAEACSLVKLNHPGPQEMLGRPDLGAGAAQRWNPQSHHYYQRQWRSQRGAWGDPGAENRLRDDVAAVIVAFRERGTVAGLVTAKQKGVLAGARLYLQVRADTEEELAARLARIRARLATQPCLADKIREAFVLARLEESREAISKGHTPPQAIIDKPEIPRRTIARWIPLTMLTLSVLAFLRSLR